MFIIEAHIMIEQGLQKIGVFAHSDIDPEEIDLQINSQMWKTMDREFPNPHTKELTKPKQDRYDVLIEREIPLVVTLDENGDYISMVPDNYFHIIKVNAGVLSYCGKKNVPSGQLETGEWYINLGEAITYNGISLPIRRIFQATTIRTYYATQLGKTTLVVKLNKTRAQCRMIEEENVTRVKSGGLTKSKPKSPIVVLAAGKIIISVDGFFLEKAYISYLRKPSRPNIKFKTYTKDNDLPIGKAFQVIEGQVSYGNVTYDAPTSGFEFPSFTFITGQARFTGQGKVRVKNDGDIQLPYQVCLDIIDRVILNLSIVSEDNPQKVQGLASVNPPIT